MTDQEALDQLRNTLTGVGSYFDLTPDFAALDHIRDRFMEYHTRILELSEEHQEAERLMRKLIESVKKWFPVMAAIKTPPRDTSREACFEYILRILDSVPVEGGVN